MANVVIENIFYVYLLRRPDKIWADGKAQPFYVGKGSGNRVRVHLWRKGCNPYKENVVQKIIAMGMEVISEKVYEDLSEEEAFEKERELIKFYGRENNGTGILCNMTDGGEGTSGWELSDETKDKMSNSHLGDKNINYGKPRSDSVKNKISLATTGRKLPKETLDKLIGRKLTDEHKKNISLAGTGRKQTEEAKEKVAASKRGISRSEETKKKISINSIGKRHTEETKQLMSEIHTGKVHSEETKQKCSEIKIGLKNPFYGKKHSEETKRKIGEKSRVNALLKKQQLIKENI